METRAYFLDARLKLFSLEESNEYCFVDLVALEINVKRLLLNVHYLICQFDDLIQLDNEPKTVFFFKTISKYYREFRISFASILHNIISNFERILNIYKNKLLQT